MVQIQTTVQDKWPGTQEHVKKSGKDQADGGQETQECTKVSKSSKNDYKVQDKQTGVYQG